MKSYPNPYSRLPRFGFFAVTYHKLFAMFGSAWVMLAVYFCLLMCFAVVRAIVCGDAPDSVSVAVVNNCSDTYSNELVNRLSESDGFSIHLLDSVISAENMLINGKAEAYIEIYPEYDNLLAENGQSGLYRIVSVPSSASSDAIRETVSGIVIAQRAYVRVRQELVDSGYESVDELLSEYMQEYDESAPKLFAFETVGGDSTAGSALFGQLYAGYSGFAALAILLLMLSLSSWLSNAESKLSSVRMEVIPHGRSLSVLTDFSALLSAGVIASAVAFAVSPSPSVKLALGLLSFCVCISGLCLLVGNLASSGAINIAAPFIALITSLLGGCFMDVGALSSFMLALSRVTPQGQLIAAETTDNILWCALLIFEGAVCVCASRLARQHR